MKHIIQAGLIIVLVFALTVSAALAESITGLVLVGDLPKDAVLTENTTDADGGYREVLTTEDGYASLTMMRQKADEGREEAIQTLDFLSGHYPGMHSAEMVAVEPVAAYPTDRVRFIMGENEDQRVVDAVVIYTDAYIFAFSADIDADAYYGFAEGYEEGDWPQSVDLWVESLDLFDAESSAAAPFGAEDVQAFTETGGATLGDYVSAYRPSHYTWHYQGEATGETYIELFCEGGNITVAVPDVKDILDPERGQDPATQLPDEAMEHSAYVRGAIWAADGFDLPAVRGLTVGASREEVIGSFPAYGDEILYDISLLNPNTDDSWNIQADFIGGRVLPMQPDASGYDEMIEYVWCELESADQWREYYTLRYFISEGQVAEIQLSYECDPE